MAASRVLAARASWQAPQLAAIASTSRSIFGHIAPSTTNLRTGRKVLRQKITAAAGRLSDLKTAHRAMVVAERMELESHLQRDAWEAQDDLEEKTFKSGSQEEIKEWFIGAKKSLYLHGRYKQMDEKFLQHAEEDWEVQWAQKEAILAKRKEHAKQVREQMAKAAQEKKDKLEAKRAKREEIAAEEQKKAKQLKTGLWGKAGIPTA